MIYSTKRNWRYVCWIKNIYNRLSIQNIFIYSSLFTENGNNYTVTAKQTTGLNKLNIYYAIIYTTHDMKI